MKKWTQVPAGELDSAIKRLLFVIDNFADEVVTRINTDSKYLVEVAQMMVSGLYKPTDSQKFAQEIMGKNIFGIEKIIRYYGILPTKEQLDALAEIPFSTDELETCKDTHVLSAVLPQSVMDTIRIAEKRSGQKLFCEQDWYKKLQFARDKGEIGWQLVPKRQVNRASMMSAQIAVYTIIGHFLATGEWMIGQGVFYCRDIISEHQRAFIMCDKVLILDVLSV